MNDSIHCFQADSKFKRNALSLRNKPSFPFAAFMKQFTTSSVSTLQHSQSLNPNSHYNTFNDERCLSHFGVYRDAAQVTASHLFAYKHGQDAMDGIFSKIRPEELFSSRNGIIMSTEIEMHFDSGVLAIVPDLPDKPTACCTVFVFPLLHPSALPCLEGWPQ